MMLRFEYTILYSLISNVVPRGAIGMRGAEGYGNDGKAAK